MKKLGTIVSIAAGILLMAAVAWAQNGDFQGHGQAVVTVLPAHPELQNARIDLKDVKIKVNGKQASVTGWTPLQGAGGRTQIVLLIDGSAGESLGTQMGEIRDFVKEMPTDTTMAIAYMSYGRAVFTGPLSSDPAVVLRGLHLPTNFVGGSGSPYFCLSELAKHWPSQDQQARRVVVMITDGMDRYYMQYNPDDPYVQAAIKDAVRARLVVYTIYWRDRGSADRGIYENDAGQNLLIELTQATGGDSYWIGMGNPVTFQPYFHDIRSRLRNQYELSFAAPLSGKPAVQSLKLNVSVPSAKIVAPQQVYVSREGSEPV